MRIVRAMLLLILLCAALPLGACSEVDKGRSGNADENPDQVRIGLSMATMQEERWSKDRDIFVAKAKQFGAQVIVQNADNDADEQYRQVEYLLAQKIDVLVIVCQDANKAAQCVSLAKRMKVPVVCYDRLVLDADVDVYVSFDHVGVGKKMAQELIKAVPSGNYLVINGPTSDYNSTLFREGYMGVLQPFIVTGSIRVLNEIWAKDWRREEAYEFVHDSLIAYDKIDAIIAANDSLAEGAIEALSEWRLAGKVLVTGHDADLAACQRVAEGTQYMTVYKPLARLTEEAVRVCMLIAEGEPLNIEKTINNGKIDVPYDMIDTVKVNKENLEETVIKDGFHLYEKVFQNVKK